MIPSCYHALVVVSLYDVCAFVYEPLIKLSFPHTVNRPLQLAMFDEFRDIAPLVALVAIVVACQTTIWGLKRMFGVFGGSAAFVALVACLVGLHHGYKVFSHDSFWVSTAQDHLHSTDSWRLGDLRGGGTRVCAVFTTSRVLVSGLLAILYVC